MDTGILDGDQCPRIQQPFVTDELHLRKPMHHTRYTHFMILFAHKLHIFSALYFTKHFFSYHLLLLLEVLLLELLGHMIQGLKIKAGERVIITWLQNTSNQRIFAITFEFE